MAAARLRALLARRFSRFRTFRASRRSAGSGLDGGGGEGRGGDGGGAGLSSAEDEDKDDDGGGATALLVKETIANVSLHNHTGKDAGFAGMPVTLSALHCVRRDETTTKSVKTVTGGGGDTRLATGRGDAPGLNDHYHED